MNSTQTIEGHPIVDPLPQPTPRRDSASTTSSSISPGYYTLPIHGNCPRCHHRHRAANIRISRDSGRVSRVNCEKCGGRWLSFGGPNATSISLLSSQTIDIDPADCLRAEENNTENCRSHHDIRPSCDRLTSQISTPDRFDPGDWNQWGKCIHVRKDGKTGILPTPETQWFGTDGASFQFQAS